MYYTHVSTPIGPMFVAGDGDVVARISFTTGHQVRYPEPGWKQDASALEPATRQIEQYFAGERRDFKLKLTMEGTDFQRRVWEALIKIPFGQTRSYGDVAKELGSPGASRAVGRANATNHLPLVIPCHRVIGANGTLTGFGGGLDTKQWLLQFEGAFEAPPAPPEQQSLF